MDAIDGKRLLQISCVSIKHSIRCFHVSHSLSKVVLNRSKNRSQSSLDWLRRQLSDPYVRKARYENYRARSAFKLIEIDQKHSLFHPGMIVIDCGAAPGSWTQYLVKKLELEGEAPHRTGAVIAIDIRAIHPIPGAIVMPNTDFTKPLNQSKILHALNGKSVDVVCSDMAPNASGQRDLDSHAIHNLCYSALQFAVTVLKSPTGVFLTKVWDGSQTSRLKQDLSDLFQDVRHLRPDASRGDSTESYLLARNFGGISR